MESVKGRKGEYGDGKRKGVCGKGEGKKRGIRKR